MAPEQLEGKPTTNRTDIYALGIVIFEMLTGRRPFQGDSEVAIAHRQVSESFPSAKSLVPSLDPQWDRVIGTCLKKDPAARFESADQVVEAIHSRGRRLVRHRLFMPSIAAAAVVALAIGSLAWFGVPGFMVRVPSQQRVAVLEFENVGGDPANRAFCEGLMQTLAGQLTELQQFQGSLSVVPASDIRKDKVTSPREAQRQFGVNLAIAGSVQRSKDGVKLIVTLVDAKALKQLRSHSMFVPATDAVAMQEGVVRDVTNLLDLELRPEASKRLAKGNTAVPGAYDFYLQGTGYLLAGNPTLDQAITEFQHALELDGNYALAYAGLGQAYWNKYVVTRDKAWVDRSREACEKAFRLNPDLGAAHLALAVLNNGTGKYEEGMREAQQAISIDPTDSQAYAELARAQERLHQPEQAEATLNKAISLRPNYWNNYMRLGALYNRLSKYSDAEKTFRHLIELVPDNPVGYSNMGGTLLNEGRDKDAEPFLKKSIEVRPNEDAYSNLATAYFNLGNYSAAVPVMEQLTKGGTRRFDVWGNLGDAYRWAPGKGQLAAGAYAKAIEYALKAIEINPKSGLALSSLAMYEAKSGDLKRAVRDSERAFDAEPGNSAVLVNVSIALEVSGQREEALRYLGVALSRGYPTKVLEKDPELKNLRNDNRYTTLVAMVLGTKGGH
jgi:serine/threonine-protein kinase